MYFLFLRTRRFLAFVLFTGITIVSSIPCNAQTTTADTLRLDLPSLEKRFLDSNLLLLASHYNVDAQKALIQQAKLWDNHTDITPMAHTAVSIMYSYNN
jgi:cobalt-zinc-cadmium efflux system outer membrane protein